MLKEVSVKHEPFRIEGPNDRGEALLIVGGFRVSLGPWESAAEIMCKWLEHNDFGE